MRLTVFFCAVVKKPCGVVTGESESAESVIKHEIPREPAEERHLQLEETFVVDEVNFFG